MSLAVAVDFLGDLSRESLAFAVDFLEETSDSPLTDVTGECGSCNRLS